MLRRFERRIGEAERRVMLPAVVPPPPPLQPPKPNWDAALEAMNMQHAIIENVGGKTVIASWEPPPIDLDRLMVVFQSKVVSCCATPIDLCRGRSLMVAAAFKRSQQRCANGGSHTVIGFSFAA